MQELSFIREQDASGQTAALFDDIRSTMGIATANLIWRHLATMPGAAQSAWASAKPLYQSGRVVPAATQLAHQISLASVAPWNASTLHDCIGQAASVADVDAVIATYNRGNALNLVALKALTATPANGDDGIAAPPLEVPSRSLPAVPELDELPTTSVECVLRLNRYGTPPDSPDLVATLYKHLAHWPAFLTLVDEWLAPMADDGSLDALIAATAAAADRQATQLAATLDEPVELTVEARTAIDAFVRAAIVRMLPIGLMLRSKLAYRA